jgi:hypothetical protein
VCRGWGGSISLPGSANGGGGLLVVGGACYVEEIDATVLDDRCFILRD